MKSLNIVIASFALLMLNSCKEKEVEQPKVIYETNKSSQNAIKDSSKIDIADLPIQFKGTNFLIHPLGDVRVYEGASKSSYGSANADRVSFTISNVSDNEITGFLRNIKFQEVGSDSIKALTDQRILIQTITYLKSVSDKTKQQVLVYTLSDKDTNKDNKVDTSDIKTLYLSSIDGSRFTKVSQDIHELIDWNLIESKNLLYFRTIEDTNKNGQFDKNDVLHYSYIDLSNKDWKVMNYNPM